MSESVNYEQYSEHESDTEQEGKDTAIPTALENTTACVDEKRENKPEIQREDLEDVPLSHIRLGKYIGKDNDCMASKRAITKMED